MVGKEGAGGGLRRGLDEMAVSAAEAAAGRRSDDGSAPDHISPSRFLPSSPSSWRSNEQRRLV